MTFYCKDDLPDDIFLAETLSRITEYVLSALVYSTPFVETWKAYCDAMVHGLLDIDRTRDLALMVYTYNELTQNISGQFVEKRSEKKDGVCPI